MGAGTLVFIHGLKNKQEINGKLAEIIHIGNYPRRNAVFLKEVMTKENFASVRYEVRLVGDENSKRSTYGIRPQNLFLARATFEKRVLDRLFGVESGLLVYGADTRGSVPPSVPENDDGKEGDAEFEKRWEDRELRDSCCVCHYMERDERSYYPEEIPYAASWFCDHSEQGFETWELVNKIIWRNDKDICLRPWQPSEKSIWENMGVVRFHRDILRPLFVDKYSSMDVRAEMRKAKESDMSEYQLKNQLKREKRRSEGVKIPCAKEETWVYEQIGLDHSDVMGG